MTELTEYKWCKIKNGLPFFGLIVIEVSRDSENSIIENYSGEGFFSQGSLEEIPEIGYDTWKLAIKNGLNYALSKVETNWTIKIHKFGGLTTDTNSAIAGYTAIRAFWHLINFTPEIDEIKEIENFVFDSWKQKLNQGIPNYFDLTYSDFRENK